MSKSIPFIQLDNSVNLSIDGELQTVHKSDLRFDGIIKALSEKDWEAVREAMKVENALDGIGLTLKDGRFYDGDIELPEALSDRIPQLKDEGHTIEPLVNFWNELKGNPSFNSRKMLYRFLEHNGHPLTEDGCFIAYRGVTSDFRDPHTRTFDNSVGSVCEMPREEVDENPNNTCSRGLHVAAYTYAHGFGSQTIEVKVNPKDVVCVPTDYNGTKMRVCRFEVTSVCRGIRNEALYNSPRHQEEEIAEHDTGWDYCD